MGVLLMLMTIGGSIVAIVLLIASSVTGNRWLTKFTLSAVAVWFSFYAVMLVGSSLRSSEKDLGLNEAKEFCGFYLDCHIHAAVTDVRTEKQIGDRKANGVFQVVNVRVFSDAKNPSIKLRLLEPNVRVVLATGEAIERDLEAEKLLPTASLDLSADIKGRQTIEKEIVFDLPAGTSDAKLLMTEGYGIDRVIERFLIGDEDSIFHAQKFLKLQEQMSTVGLQ